MVDILTALLPIFALILMGFLLRQKRLLAEAFWLPCEQLNYFYLFPILMFSQVAKADLARFQILPLAAAVLGAVLIGAGVLVVWKIWRGQSGEMFSSVIQGAVRPNTYVGVAAAAAMYGSTGLTVTSICIAVAIPLLNVASIVILMLYGSGRGPTVRQIVRALVTNPVIVSVLAGALFNLSGLHLPQVIGNFFAILGSASLPLGLLAVGAGLDLKAAKSAHGPVLQSSIVKLLLVPLLTLWIGLALNITGPELAVIVLFNSLPCTPSAYIMAKLLGGDHRLAASIITVQTVLAALTMPILMTFAHS